MVWASSTRFGVGKSRSRTGKTIVVAHYFPKGNLVEFCGKFFIPNAKTEPSKFLSTFPGVPINNDYYILDTDYRDGQLIN